MLKIRPEQLQALEHSTQRAFENEMVAHAKKFAPTLSQVIGDEQLRLAVRAMIEKARQMGFTLRGPIRLCIELMFLFGSGFDSDPQYQVLADILRSSGNEMDKAESVHQAHNAYMAEVAAQNINVRKALEAVCDYARNAPELTRANLDSQLLGLLSRAYPQRASFVGEAKLRSLIDEGRAAAATHGLTSARHQALIVILMSAFGHNCTADPLYPWISQTLTDPKTVDASARGARLEKKAITWLDHVLATPSEGMPE